MTALYSVILTLIATISSVTAQTSTQTSTQPSSQTVTQASTQVSSATNSVLSSQSSRFRDALSAYSASFRSSPQYSGLMQNLFFDLPDTVLPSVRTNPGPLIPVPTGTAFDLHSFATNPPTSFPQLDWETYLTDHASISSSIDGLRTSAVLALATSAQSVIGTTVSIAVPSTSTSTGGAAVPTVPAYAGSAISAAAGLIGAAAVLL